MKLTVICPGIRPDNWYKLYNSVTDAFMGDFQMIFIGPYDLPENLRDRSNIKYIKSFRSPIACQQQGLIAAEGEWIAWAADDGVYISGTLLTSFELLEGQDYKTIIVSKYQEGDNPIGMDNDWYYTLSNHDTMKLPGVPKDAMLLNCGLVSRQLLLELGGWEARRFQVCPMSYNDLSIRAYKYGAKFILQPNAVFKCGHMPGATGDHGPIHIGQTEYDQPIFTGIYSNENDRIKIDINNWMESEERWPLRRF